MRKFQILLVAYEHFNGSFRRSRLAGDASLVFSLIAFRQDVNDDSTLAIYTSQEEFFDVKFVWRVRENFQKTKTKNET